MLCERCQREIVEILNLEPGKIISWQELLERAEDSTRAKSQDQGRHIRVQSANPRGGNNTIFVGFDGRTYRQTSMDEYFARMVSD